MENVVIYSAGKHENACQEENSRHLWHPAPPKTATSFGSGHQRGHSEKRHAVEEVVEQSGLENLFFRRGKIVEVMRAISRRRNCYRAGNPREKKPKTKRHDPLPLEHYPFAYLLCINVAQLRLKPTPKIDALVHA